MAERRLMCGRRIRRGRSRAARVAGEVMIADRTSSTKTATRTFGTAGRKKALLKVSTRNDRRIRRALERGEAAKVEVEAVFTDAAGNEQEISRTIGVRRGR